MRTKLLFPTSLFFLTLLLILYINPANAGNPAKSGTSAPELSYKCLGNGEFLVTVKVEAVQRYIQYPTFCVISVTPDISKESSFTYHLNHVGGESNDIASLGAPTATTAASQRLLVFSRVLNLGVYKDWCTFSVKFDQASIGGNPHAFVEMKIDKCKQPCTDGIAAKKAEAVYAGLFPEKSKTEVNKKKSLEELEQELKAKQDLELGSISKYIAPNSIRVSVKEFEEIISAMETAKEMENESPMYTDDEDPFMILASEKRVNLTNPRSLILYPNPSSGSVELRLQGTQDKTFRLEIYDIQGKLVSEYKNINGIYTLEKNSLKPGVYKVLMNGDAGGFYHATLIMQ